MKHNRNSILQSSAGITKYDDEYKNTIQLNPKAILYFGFSIAIIILTISYIYGTWPIKH